MRRCRECAGELEAAFRFCPFCAAPQRTKFVEFFLPHPAIPEHESQALRVTRYLGVAGIPPQVRFSIWRDDTAEAVVAVDENEAARLAEFLGTTGRRRRALDDLSASLGI